MSNEFGTNWQFWYANGDISGSPGTALETRSHKRKGLLMQAPGSG